jgi:hypothetical protein
MLLDSETMIQVAGTFVFGALATTGISCVITRAHITKPIREAADETHVGWVHKLFSCAYCMSHWVATGVTFVLFPQIYLNPINWVLLIFATTVLAAIFMGLVDKLLHFSDKQIEELKEQIQELQKNK